MAYGQTGTGKTFTMMGTPTDLGIIPRMLEGIFQRITELDAGVNVQVSATFLQIHNDNLYDLLENTKQQLKIRAHPEKGAFVPDLSSW